MSDLIGSITLGSQVLKLDGHGSQVGDKFQFDLNITSADNKVPTLSQVQSGMLYYFKLTPSTQWQSIDINTTPGNVPNIQSDIPGLNGFNPNGAQRTFDEVKQVTEVGKEAGNGAATTKYQGDVDVAKLFTSIGVPAAQAAQAALVSKLTVYIWIGDTDGYLHQTRGVLNTKPVGPGGQLFDVVVDFTLTNRDFGTPVSITVPADSVPYVIATPGPPPLQNTPTATSPESTVVPVTEEGTPVVPGMPTTGGGGMWSLFLVLISGLGCFMLGAIALRIYSTLRER